MIPLRGHKSCPVGCLQAPSLLGHCLKDLRRLDWHEAQSPHGLSSHARQDLRVAAGSKSPGTLARGPKQIRQGHAPQRDTSLTQNTVDGNVKRAKAKNGGEGYMPCSTSLITFYYKH